MWILTSVYDKEKIYYLLLAKEIHTVGRKGTDITIENDSSISRKHVTIYIANKNQCPFAVSTHLGAWLVDEGSRYGTFFYENESWVPIKPSENFQLQHGMKIRFGILKNYWRVEYRPLYYGISSLTPKDKEIMIKKLSTIDGISVNQISSCQYLFVNSIFFTIKTLMAMIYGIPIVTAEYADKLIASIQNNEEHPDISRFKPSVLEASIRAEQVKFYPPIERTKLFENKLFLCISEEQMALISKIITAAGGEIQLLKNFDESLLRRNNTIVVQYPGFGAQTQDSEITVPAFAHSLDPYLSSIGRRLVPQTEIPLAIGYNSIEKYCNPLNENYTPAVDVGPIDLGIVIAEASQEVTKTNYILPNSVASPTQEASSLSGKRKISETISHPSKRSKIRSEEDSCERKTLINVNFSTTSKRADNELLTSSMSEDTNFSGTSSNIMTECRKTNESCSLRKAYKPPELITSTPLTTSEASTSRNFLSEPHKTRHVQKASEIACSDFWNEESLKTPKETSNTFKPLENNQTSKRKPDKDSQDPFFMPEEKRLRHQEVDSSNILVTLINRANEVAVTNPPVVRKTAVDVDLTDFIDVSNLHEDKCDKSAINTTIIVQPLINRRGLSVADESQVNDIVDGVKNVKIFKKQPILY